MRAARARQPRTSSLRAHATRAAGAGLILIGLPLLVLPGPGMALLASGWLLLKLDRRRARRFARSRQ